MTGAGGGGGGWGRVFLLAGFVVGLQVGGGVLGCSRCLGFGSAVPVPHVPGHLTSICKEGVK